MATLPAKASAPAPIVRKRPPVSIFNTRNKRKPAKRQLPAQTYTANGQVSVNGARPQATQKPQTTNGAQPASEPEDDPSTYDEYSIMITKSQLMKGLHYHGFRLQSRLDRNGQLEKINPYDETQFQRPVRLYRRRPQDKPMMNQPSAAASDVDDKEREQREAKRSERQAEREANQLLIAPTGETGKKPVKKKQQKKVEDVYYDEMNPKNQERSQLRYEEARPWHLEDFDGKNKWIGAFERPLTNRHVLLEVSESGFHMIPVEKWYRMTQTDRVKLLSDDKIEKMMAAKHKPAKWFRSTQEAAEDAKREATAAKLESIQQARRAQSRYSGGDGDETPAGLGEEYRADVDEIDFDWDDEFADDDEGMVFGDQNDEEAKETERRLRAEQRQANLPDAQVKGAEEEDWINEEKERELAELEERKKQKRIRKQLKKKEYRAEYDSDDERNLWESSSEDDDSDDEQELLEEEKKNQEAQKTAPNGDKPGTPSKGTNTPTGRPENKTLKRDADLSELSGNESSRKKAKLNGTTSGTATARSLSPDTATSKRVPSGYGSGSETDTSRAGRPRISKIKVSPPGSPHEGTPAASRAGSVPGSRAGSPARQPALGPFPTLEEVKAAIPAEGVTISELIAKFKSRIAKDKNADFIALVKQAGKQEPSTKKIIPKD